VITSTPVALQHQFTALLLIVTEESCQDFRDEINH
jgi:hypothetical protein